jgi:hypothetical protein
MRNNVSRHSYGSLLLVAGLFVAMSAPAAGKTNWFGATAREPVPQWAMDAARTPTPASAKDASAVMLFDEYLITVDEQNHAVERERRAVRVLKPQGRQYGQFSIGYDVDAKLNYFHSWTIGADGKQYQATETDFKDEGFYAGAVMQSTERIRRVNPPADAPGSVVVCETEERLRPYMNEEDWLIQTPIPIVLQAMELDLPPSGHYAEAWSRFSPVRPVEVAPNHLRWEIEDMSAIDLENIYATHPWRALAARMGVKWGDLAAKDKDSQWRAIGLWQEQLEAHRTDSTPEITAKARKLTDGAPDLYTKLSLIADFIQKNLRYFEVERGIGNWQSHYANEILRNGYGDNKDKATLMISMLQAIGIQAHYLQADSNRGTINPNAPLLAGDRMITAIELPEGECDPRLLARVRAVNGKTLLIFDPTDEETPIGLIRNQLQGAYANLIDGAESQVLQMPVMPPESAGVSRKGAFILAADGSLAGDLTETYTGANGSNERSFIKQNDSNKVRERIEKRLGSDLPGLTFKGYEFHQAANLDKPLELDMHLNASNYAHSSGPLLLLRPRVLGSHARVVPDVMEGKKRIYPIELGHPGRWRDCFDIKLPEGFAVDEAPEPVNADFDFASYQSRVTAKEGLLHYEREYVVRQVEIPAERAADFRKLESAILFDEKETVVLHRAQ